MSQPLVTFQNILLLTPEIADRIVNFSFVNLHSRSDPGANIALPLKKIAETLYLFE